MILIIKKTKLKRLYKIIIANFQVLGCFWQMQCSEKKKTNSLNVLRGPCIFNSIQTSPWSLILHLTLHIFVLLALPLRSQRLQHVVWMTSNISFISGILWFSRPGTELAFNKHKYMLNKWVNSSGEIYIYINSPSSQRTRKFLAIPYFHTMAHIDTIFRKMLNRKERALNKLCNFHTSRYRI